MVSSSRTYKTYKTKKKGSFLPSEYYPQFIHTLLYMLSLHENAQRIEYSKRYLPEEWLFLIIQ